MISLTKHFFCLLGAVAIIFPAQAQLNQNFQSFSVIDAAALSSQYQTHQHSWEGELVEMGPLYNQVLRELDREYKNIADRQIKAIEGENGLSVVGGLNSLGINYQKSFIDFNISVNRQLAPDLFDSERWIVTDEFSIEIDASKLISNLKEKKILNISEFNYGAFAGISFKRKYKYIHFADSYADGLTMNIERLFFTFLYFKNRKILNLKPYEFLQKQDFISFNMGAVASAPIYGPIGVSAAALAHFTRIANFEIQAIGPGDVSNPGEVYRISQEHLQRKDLGVSASVQLDFFKLLQISLLTYDLNYSMEKSQKTYLKLHEYDLNNVDKNHQVNKLLKALLSNKRIRREVIAQYEASYENRKKEKLNSKYMLLTLGGTVTKDTEYVEVVKEGKIREFFRHNYERVKVIQNTFSRFLSILFKSFLKMDTIVNNNFRDAKTLRMEYESEKDIIKSKSKLETSQSSENFTMSFTREYFANKTTGRKGKKYKKEIDLILADYTNVSSNVLLGLETNYLRGPIKVSHRYQINNDAIKHLNSLSKKQVYSYIKKVCSKKSKSIFSFFRSLFGSCKYKTNKKFERYYTELWNNSYQFSSYKECKKTVSRFPFFKRRFLQRKCLETKTQITTSHPTQIPLWRLKDFVDQIHVNSKTKLDMYNFFGIEHTFLYGKLEARTASGSNFHSYFSEGKFHGLGVIDQGLQQSGMRSPSSITIE